MSDIPGDRIDISVGGDVSGQIVAGRDNTTISSVSATPVTPAELADLRALIGQVRQLVAEHAGDHTDAGLAKLVDLEEAVTADKPDLATMEHVLGWFSRKISPLAGSVREIIVNPIVTRLVAAAGDTLAADFRRRFGL